MSFWFRRGAILQRFTFSTQVFFWSDFWVILAGFGGPFWSRNGSEMASTIDETTGGFLELFGRALGRQGRLRQV